MRVCIGGKIVVAVPQIVKGNLSQSVLLYDFCESMCYIIRLDRFAEFIYAHIVTDVIRITTNLSLLPLALLSKEQISFNSLRHTNNSVACFSLGLFLSDSDNPSVLPSSHYCFAYTNNHFFFGSIIVNLRNKRGDGDTDLSERIIRTAVIHQLRKTARMNPAAARYRKVKAPEVNREPSVNTNP